MAYKAISGRSLARSSVDIIRVTSFQRFFTEENLATADETYGSRDKGTIRRGLECCKRISVTSVVFINHKSIIRWSAFPLVCKMGSVCKFISIGSFFLILFFFFFDKIRPQREQMRKRNWRGHLLHLSAPANVSTFQGTCPSQERLT